MSLASSKERERTAFLYWGATGCADYPADVGPEVIAAVERVREDGNVRDALVRGRGCLHVVCKLIERSARETRDSDAWLVVGPLEENEAADIARDAELIARGLQGIPRRLLKAPTLDAIPKVEDSPAGWGIRHAGGARRECRLIELEVSELESPPETVTPPTGSDGLTVRRDKWVRLRRGWPLAAAFILGFIAGAVYQKVRASKTDGSATAADSQEREHSNQQPADGNRKPQEDLEDDGQNTALDGSPSLSGRVSFAKKGISR